MIKVQLGLSRQTDLIHTHFPRKVCTVEFGVVLAGLHRFVWQFPLLSKEEVRNAFHNKEKQRIAVAQNEKAAKLKSCQLLSNVKTRLWLKKVELWQLMWMQQSESSMEDRKHAQWFQQDGKIR